MKTKPELFWLDALNSVQFGDADTLEALHTLSADWVTCACGKQDPRIPRHEAGAPKDALLSTLGVEFCGAIGALRMNRYRERHHEFVNKAINCLQRIERRAKEVLAAIPNDR